MLWMLLLGISRFDYFSPSFYGSKIVDTTLLEETLLKRYSSVQALSTT